MNYGFFYNYRSLEQNRTLKMQRFSKCTIAFLYQIKEESKSSDKNYANMKYEIKIFHNIREKYFNFFRNLRCYLKKIK